MLLSHSCKFLGLSCLLTLSYCCFANPPSEITFSYQINPSEPYQMGTGIEVQDPPGVALDIINAAANELNLSIRFERHPNVRVLHLLENGAIDGAFMFSYKPERAQIGQYPTTADGELDGSKRLASLSYWLYSYDGTGIEWEGQKLKQVKGAIAAEHGDSIVGDLEQLGHEVFEPQSAYKALMMLEKHNRVVGAALQDIKAEVYLNQPEFKGIKRSATPFRSKDYFLVLSNDFVNAHPELAKAIWRKIGELREKVTEQVMAQYITR